SITRDAVTLNVSQVRPDGARIACLDAHDARLDHDAPPACYPRAPCKRRAVSMAAADPAARKRRGSPRAKANLLLFLAHAPQIARRSLGFAIADPPELHIEFVIDLLHAPVRVPRTRPICEVSGRLPRRRRNQAGPPRR